MEESTRSTSIAHLGCPIRPTSLTSTRANQDHLKIEISDSSKKEDKTTSLELHGVVVPHQHSKEEIENPIVPRHLIAIQLNYEGVCLLQAAKDEDKAIALLKKSLAYVKSDLSSRNSSSSSTKVGTSPEIPQRSTTCSSTSRGLDNEVSTRAHPGSINGPLVASPSLESSNGHHHVDHPMIVPVQVHEPSSLDDNLFVYTKAFVFQPCLCHGEPGHYFHNISCSCSMVDSELLSATIIYNIGLGLHIKGVRTKSSLLKQQSLSLYEMSVGLFRRILNGNNNDNNSNRNDDDSRFVNVNVVTNAICTSLLIACSNNIGHLSYYLQDDYERSRRTMSNLKFLLNRFWAGLIPEHREARGLKSTHSGSSSLSMFPLEHADIQGFTWNIRFMHPPTFAPAA